jgi:hypothetical protein
MPKQLICTICSTGKSPKGGLLPATKRYLSDRINRVKTLADSQKTPFVIFSGKYGLLKPDDLIPNYDHLLKPEEVPALAKKVIGQIKGHDFDEIIFYFDPNKLDETAPYLEVLNKLADILDITLTKISID